MSCTNNLCLDQLLEPDPDDEFLILQNNGSVATFEAGVVPIAQGATQVDVTFASPKLSNQYSFSELAVENLVDQSPLAIGLTVVMRAKTGFSALLSALPDTANYQLRFSVQIVSP